MKTHIPIVIYFLLFVILQYKGKNTKACLNNRSEHKNNKEKNDRLPRKLKSKRLEKLSLKKKKSTF